MNNRNKSLKCATWLSQCLSFGWEKESIPALEKLWNDHHDEKGDILPHLPKSTENLSKIANKDEWLNEVRGNEGFKNDIAERILDKLYSPKMHWKCVNRKNVLKAMEEFAKQYSDSKLSELEKWIDTYTEFFEFSSSQLKDKIKSLKQQS